jgi:3-methyl-2-oxobutanoate hydroxymethyltransferase
MLTLNRLREMKRAGEKIAVLTAYDASFAALAIEAGMDVLLVGDSLGMVLQGRASTLEVSVRDMAYHSRCVRAGAPTALLVTDMPFMSYATPAQAMKNAARLMSQGGANVVKLEGGGWLAETVAQLHERGIPVCAHLGLLPQSIHKLGGYRVQGRDDADAASLLEDARCLDQAGAALLVLECIPSALAAEISRSVSMPTIGIGCGPHCDGQVLVLHDVIGISRKTPRHARNFLINQIDIKYALAAYVAAVKSGEFPGPEHTLA